MMREVFAAHGVPHVVHADRGTAMTSKTVAQLLEDLDVTRSHSRPRVSNDNPYSEALFKTVKYAPAFPERFANLAAARAHMDTFTTGTTTTITTPASACTPPPTSTTTAPKPLTQPAGPPSPPPAPSTPNDSHPPPRRYPKRCSYLPAPGSTSRYQSTPRNLRTPRPNTHWPHPP